MTMDELRAYRLGLRDKIAEHARGLSFEIPSDSEWIEEMRDLLNRLENVEKEIFRRMR